MPQNLPGAPELLTRNPTIFDALTIYRSRFSGKSLLDPLRDFADQAEYFNWRGFVAPPITLRTVPARGTVQDQMSVRTGTFLLMAAGYSQQAAGFRFKITDVGSSKDVLSSDYCLSGVECGSGDPQIGNAPMPFIVPSPRAISEPGQILIQIVNLATVTNYLELFLTFAEPV